MTTSCAEPRVLRADDPEATRLLDAGARLVSESWGARMTVDDGVLARCRAAVGAATEAGWSVGPVGPDGATDVVDLDLSAAADYPRTAATAHDPPEPGALAAALAGGTRWAFGAWAAGRLDAVTVLTDAGDRVETDFTVTRASARRRGLATAVKGAAVLALAADGRSRFGTGGAAVNAGSRRANEALGYVVVERWLHLVP